MLYENSSMLVYELCIVHEKFTAQQTVDYFSWIELGMQCSP